MHQESRRKLRMAPSHPPPHSHPLTAALLRAARQPPSATRAPPLAVYAFQGDHVRVLVPASSPRSRVRVVSGRPLVTGPAPPRTAPRTREFAKGPHESEWGRPQAGAAGRWAPTTRRGRAAAPPTRPAPRRPAGRAAAAGSVVARPDGRLSRQPRARSLRSATGRSGQALGSSWWGVVLPRTFRWLDGFLQSHRDSGCDATGSIKFVGPFAEGADLAGGERVHDSEGLSKIRQSNREEQTSRGAKRSVETCNPIVCDPSAPRGGE